MCRLLLIVCPAEACFTDLWNDEPGLATRLLPSIQDHNLIWDLVLLLGPHRGLK